MRSLKQSSRHIRPRCRLLSSNSSAPPVVRPITSVLIANRGEVALRIARTAAAMGIRTTTIYTDVDARSQHVGCGAQSLALGAQASGYLDGPRIVELARRHGIAALHPGYGFLSENAGFARACQEAGVVFVGPPWQAMADMGDKARSKEVMTAAGVACVPGYHGPEQSVEELAVRAAEVGYPVLLKSVRGGGGKGMRVVRNAHEFAAQLRSARAEARASFGDGGEVMLVERYVERPRHVEVQVFADGQGACVALGERDCSVQRRHQKVLEESPAPGLDEALRRQLWHDARKAALAVGYVGAGTVEFLLDRDTGDFFFMEMNTRLQVEHPVSELVTGLDLVEWQFRVAQGEPLPLTQEEVEERMRTRGHAVEARIYAERPARGFMPDSGLIEHVATPTPRPDEVRIDQGYAEGDVVSEAYDGMLAKLIVRAQDRDTAVRKLHLALLEYEVAGPSTNVEFLKRLCLCPAFVAGDVETGFIEKWRHHLFAPRQVPPHAFAQAALALFLTSAPADALHGPIGFGVRPSTRFAFGMHDDVEDGSHEEPATVEVTISPRAMSLFEVKVAGAGPAVVFDKVGCEVATSEPTKTKTRLTSLFPDQRISSTIVRHSSDPARLTLFQHGEKTELLLLPPAWQDKAQGPQDTPSLAAVAPMPCRVLRHEVVEGQAVAKGEALVVIESMKMETVIRSPRHGVVKKLVHKDGDICKAGTVLVLFEEEASGESKQE